LFPPKMSFDTWGARKTREQEQPQIPASTYEAAPEVIALPFSLVTDPSLFTSRNAFRPGGGAWHDNLHSAPGCWSMPIVPLFAV
jgi:hypothetical protein